MRPLLLFLAACLLAGCGGGGGGGGSVPSATTTTPSGSSGVQSATVQRTLVQQSLTSTDDSTTIAQFGTSSNTLDTVRRVMGSQRLPQGCTDGEIVTTSATSESNVESITLDAYYDSGCSTLWYVMQGTLTATSSTSGTANVTFTYYTTSGTVYRYAGPVVLTLSGVGTGSGYFSLQAAVANAPNASPFTNIGIGCAISSTSDSCSIAEADHLATLGLDEAAAIGVSAGIASSGSDLVIGLNGSGAAYTGSLDATNVTATGAYTWGITGGSEVDADSLTGSLTLSQTGILVAGSLSLTDSADGATVTASYNPSSQTIAGTVTQTASGTVVASFAVNLTGSGTLTYSTGATGTIANWVVQS